MSKYGVTASLPSVSRKKAQEKSNAKLKPLLEQKEIKDFLDGSNISKSHTPTDVTAATSRNTQTPVKRAHPEEENKKSIKPQSRKASVVKTPAVKLSVQHSAAPKTPLQVPKGLKSAFGKSSLKITTRREKFPHFWRTNSYNSSASRPRYQAI